MSETTPKLSLPYILPSQAQKHVTHNEALRALDVLVQLAVASNGADDPPAEPAEGERHIIGDTPTGGWAGQAGKVGAWQDGGWVFYEPQDGWLAWSQADSRLLVFHDGQWNDAEQPVTVVQNGEFVGVNTTADAASRLAVASPASLFTHEGAGHQLKINKAAAGDTASVLFQDGWSARAEFGLTGDDDWHVKVSPDGAAWHEAIVVDRESGKVALPANGLVVDRTLALNLLPDSGRFQGNSGNHTHVGSYATPSYLSVYNGSTITNYGEFIHDSSTYGGSGDPLAAEVDALIQKIRAGGNKRYGIEWNVAEIAQGPGTASPLVIGADTFPLTLTSGSHPMPEIFTAGFYVKVKTGKLIPRVGGNQTRISYDGTDKGTALAAEHILQNSDGWAWVEVAGGDYAGLGYNQFALSLAMTPGSECWYALPKVVPGNVRLHGLEVLPNNKLFGG